MIDPTEKLKQGRLAALHVAVWGIVLSIFVSAAVGFFFAESDDALMRRAHFAVAALGIGFTGIIVYRILTGDIAEHHYRERLKAERDAALIEAEIAEANAKAALYAAKERAIYTPLPGRTAPALPEPSAPAIYHNGKRIDESAQENTGNEYADDDADDDEMVAPAPKLGAPYRSNRAGFVINESAQAYDLRMHRLASEIYDLCRDVNPPTQADIKARIPITKGGLLRSNDDITRALNLLAARRLIEPERGQGITRHWLDGQGNPLPKTARQRGITSNVRVMREGVGQ